MTGIIIMIAGVALIAAGGFAAVASWRYLEKRKRIIRDRTFGENGK